MSKPAFARVVTACLLTFTGLAVGCNKMPDITKPTGLSVTSVSPNAGLADYAAQVRIVGMGFQPGATVTADDAATDVTVVNSTTITATLPIHAAGRVDVVVTNPDGQSGRLPSAFSYVGLAVTQVNPSVALGGEAVRIFCTGFGTGATVTMGGLPASVVHTDSVSITVTTPKHDEGPVDVVVTNPGGHSATLTDGFTFLIPMSLSVNATEVTAGSQMTVGWIGAANRQGYDDAILLVDLRTGAFKWANPTLGAPSGTLTLTAPTEPGQYQFQYREFDDFIPPYYRVLALSPVVTVTAASPDLAGTLALHVRSVRSASGLAGPHLAAAGKKSLPPIQGGSKWAFNVRRWA